MWLMTRQGFYSVVAARKGTTKLDPSRVVVRARVRKHLENLLGMAADEGVRLACKISSSATSDYRYRLVMLRTDWRLLVSLLTNDIQYDNFKGSVRDKEYHDALMRVWQVMHGLQRDEGSPAQGYATRRPMTEE